MISCCGKNRLTKFCPKCGKQLREDGPLGELLAHVRLMTDRFRRNAEDHEENAGDDPNSWEGRRSLIARKAYRKWDAWASALEALMSKEAAE